MSNRARLTSGKKIILGILAAAAVCAVWADGELDTSFGTSGNAHVAFANSGGNDNLSAARLTAANTYLTAGTDNIGKLFTATFSSDGQTIQSQSTTDLSGTFLSANGDGGITQVLLPTDGSALLTGTSFSNNLHTAVVGLYNIATSPAQQMALFSYSDSSREYGCATAMIDANSKYAIACLSRNKTSQQFNGVLFRLNSDLTPDTGFGSSGNGQVTLPLLPSAGGTTYTQSEVTNDSSSQQGVIRDSNGRYYVLMVAETNDLTCGSRTSSACNTALYVVRLTGSGAVDTSFGANGMAMIGYVTNPSNTANRNVIDGNTLALDDVGNILVGGRIGSAQGSTPMVARLTSAGVLDSTWGASNSSIGANNGGITNVTGQNGYGFRVIAVYHPSNAANNYVYALTDQTLYRLTSNGTVDSGFLSISQSKTAYTVNNSSPTANETSAWFGFYPLAIGPNSGQAALLLAGVNSDCVGNTNCNNPAPSSPMRATVSKFNLITPTPQGPGPNDFSFNSLTGQPLNTQVRSNAITITGITAGSASISITSGGAYSIGCTASTAANDASFTSTAGTISNNQTVCVEQTTANSPAQSSSVMLSVGGKSASFTATTAGTAADTTPDNSVAGFTAVTNASINVATVSNAITITGINAPAPISISGGTSPGYSIGCNGSFTSTAGSINNNDTVCVRQTASTSANTKTTTTLTVGPSGGSIARAFDVTTGTGVVVNPSRLDFGAQSMTGSGATLTLTMTNNGTSSASYSGVSIAGANAADFTQTNNCPAPTNLGITVLPATLNAGSSCTFTVTFKPTGAGARTGSLSVTTSPAAAPSSIPLTGSSAAAAGQLVFTPTSLNMGTVAKGSTSTAQTATLRNAGNASVTITSIQSSSGEFGASNNCPLTLAVNASCMVTVTFTPSAGGTRQGSVNVLDSANSNPSLGLSGNGQSPTVALGPNALSFADQNVNTTSAAQSVTYTNTGTLTVKNIQVSVVDGSGNASSDFAANPSSCADLAANASCTINVTFTPSQANSRAGTLRVTSNADSSPDTVSLSGNGKAVSAASASLTPSTWTFSDQTINQTSAAKAFTLTNGGNSALTGIGTPALSGANSSEFVVSSTTCGSTLTAMTSCTINVSFAPTTVGTGKTATLSVATAVGTQSASLSGNGVSGVPVLSLSVNQLNFGTQKVGTTSAAQSVTATNTGSVPMTINSISTTGTNPTEFVKASSSTCGPTLNAGASCRVDVTFTPGTGGADSRQAQLTFSTNASAPQSTVALNGTRVLETQTLVVNGQVIGLSLSCGTLLDATGGSTFKISATPSGTFANTYNTPYGFFGFRAKVQGCTGPVTFIYTLPGTATVTTYLKCATSNASSCMPLSGTQATTDGKQVTFQLSDNGQNGDLTSGDGFIDDPGAPAAPPAAAAAAPSSSSGAFGWGTLLVLAVPAMLRRRRPH